MQQAERAVEQQLGGIALLLSNGVLEREPRVREVDV